MHPVTVPAHELADLLMGAEQAIASLAAQQFPELDPSTLIVGLTGVRDTSLALEFASNRPDIVAPAFQRLAAGVRARSCADFPSRSLAGLEVLASFSKRRKCKAQFWNPAVNATEPLAVMDEDFGDAIPARPRVRGETVIYGKVERVGGVEPKVRLRLTDGDWVSCALSEALARQVGGRLYEEVGLKGTATWDAGDFTLLYFHADELTPYEPIGASGAFQELRAVAAPYYADVGDVVAFVREHRYGGST